MSKPAPTCADAAVQQLASAGINVCFANPGTTEMFLVSALEQQPDLRSILCLHEAVCTGACDGYARIAGSPAAALLHLGPGLGNGLCNLHNAHRARSPMLVLVGEHATWHQSADPPLAQDIQALAATVSGQVFTINTPETAASVMQQALAALTTPVMIKATGANGSSSEAPDGPGPHHAAEPLTAAAAAAAAAAAKAGGSDRTQGCPNSRVVTVVFPHDVSWSAAPADALGPLTPAQGAAAAQTAMQPLPKLQLQHSPAAQQFLVDCVAALQAAPKGKAALVLGGQALLSDGDALPNAGRLAAALGAALLCDPMPGRISRGTGLPHCTRLPYFPQEAEAELAKYDVVLLVDHRRPVAMFGYKNGPSQLLSQPDDNIWELDAGLPAAEALQFMVKLLPAAGYITPGVNCRGMFAGPARPPLPAGRLTAAGLCQAVAALQPPGAIIIDESLTSGGAYWEASKGCEGFDHLCLTGGAIGSGPPMSVGAAVAAPGRQVINLQADGSALYTLQALWTQAREGLKVLTIICANNSYAILQVEGMRQRTGQARALTSLTGPAVDWVALATAMGVQAGRADSCEQLVALIHQGLQQQGPFLIHASLA